MRDNSRVYRRLCQLILNAEPLCRYCRHDGRIVAAAVVDHILALSLGGGSNDPANLCPSCAKCNSEKAQAERAFVRKGFDIRDIHRDPALNEWIKKAAFKSAD